MSFNPITLEVDGTLRNPVVLGAVIAWSLMLTVLFSAAVRLFRNRWAVLVIVALMVFVTPAAQNLLVNSYYVFRGFSGAGLWGHPPLWLAPSAAAILAFGSRALLRHKASSVEALTAIRHWRILLTCGHRGNPRLHRASR